LHRRVLTLPVSETNSVMGRSASEIKDDTEQQKTNEDEYLAGGHPELDLSEEGDTEDVDSKNDDNDD
jgi:hypothetical protein